MSSSREKVRGSMAGTRFRWAFNTKLKAWIYLDGNGEPLKSIRGEKYDQISDFKQHQHHMVFIRVMN